MTPVSTDPETELTERQEAIVHALVRRTPIKQIAFDQGIAPSTVNDHIKAIKRKYGFASTAELVGHFVRGIESVAPSLPPIPHLDSPLASPLSGTPSNGGDKSRMFESPALRKELRQGLTDAPALSDSMAFAFDAPWAGVREPRVVPEELDGPGATVPRLIAIAKTVALILATVVLSIMALETVDGLVLSGQPPRINGRPASKGGSRGIAMTTLHQDGKDIKALIRNAEALSDEYMAALSALKAKILTARAHPDVVPHEGQAALARLGQAERQAFASSTDLFRVHDALSDIAIRMDVEHPTPQTGFADSEMPELAPVRG